MSKLLITNARLVNEGEIREADVLVVGERIERIGSNIASQDGANVIDADGCFLLPGMIDDPGSFSGSDSSPRPERGPEPRKRMSFAILKSEAATVLIAPWLKTMASCAANDSNLFGAVVNGRPVIALTCSATFSAKPTGAFSPVPTAVPPWASSINAGNVAFIRAIPLSSCCV